MSDVKRPVRTSLLLPMWLVTKPADYGLLSTLGSRVQLPLFNGRFRSPNSRPLRQPLAIPRRFIAERLGEVIDKPTHFDRYALRAWVDCLNR